MFLDAPTFVLYRARIPTRLFKQIIEDMNLSLVHRIGTAPRRLGQGF